MEEKQLDMKQTRRREPNGFGTIKFYKGHRYRPYAYSICINGKQKNIAYFSNYRDATIFKAQYIAWNPELSPTKIVFDYKTIQTNAERFVEQCKENFATMITSINAPTQTLSLPKTINDKDKIIDITNNTEIKIPTFKELYDEWLPKYKLRNNISKSGLASHANALKHCYSILDMSVDKIKYKHYQDIIDTLTKKDLSYSTKKKVRNLISLLLQYAISMEYTTVNYSSMIKIGKNKKIRPHVPFTEDEIKAVWEIEDISNADIILILLYTGCRVSELLNLKKENVFLDDGYFKITESKTEAGIRVVPIHSRIKKFIENRMNQSGNYLFMNGDKNFSYTAFTSHWKRIMKQLGITHSTHDCRHTVASRLDSVGANEIAKRKILGHAIQNVTEGYTHKTVKELQEAIELLT